MNEKTFEEIYMGKFVVDNNLISLDERLLQYYKETETLDNKQALDCWKVFREWAVGYTNEEINRAKVRVCAKLDYPYNP